jgi:hypothetical protein
MKNGKSRKFDIPTSSNPLILEAGSVFGSVTTNGTKETHDANIRFTLEVFVSTSPEQEGLQKVSLRTKNRQSLSIRLIKGTPIFLDKSLSPQEKLKNWQLLPTREKLEYWQSSPSEIKKEYWKSLTPEEKKEYWQSVPNQDKEEYWQGLSLREKLEYLQTLSSEEKKAYWNTLSHQPKGIDWRSSSTSEQLKKLNLLNTNELMQWIRFVKYGI